MNDQFPFDHALLPYSVGKIFIARNGEKVKRKSRIPNKGPAKKRPAFSPSGDLLAYPPSGLLIRENAPTVSPPTLNERQKPHPSANRPTAQAIILGCWNFFIS